MTVRDWIASQQPAAPPALMQQMLRILGAEAEEREARTTDICLNAAARALEAILRENRFAREDAAELLAIDALTTYAFEHASGSATSLGALEDLANHGTHIFARLAERV